MNIDPEANIRSRLNGKPTDCHGSIAYFATARDVCYTDIGVSLISRIDRLEMDFVRSMEE